MDFGYQTKATTPLSRLVSTYTLKMMALISMAPMKLENIRFPLGAWSNMSRGIMGFAALCSTRTKAGEATLNRTRDTMTSG